MSARAGEALPKEPAGDAASPPAPGPLSAAHLVQNWELAYDRAISYLGALGIAASERATLAERAVRAAFSRERWGRDNDALAETMLAVRELPEQGARTDAIAAQIPPLAPPVSRRAMPPAQLGRKAHRDLSPDVGERRRERRGRAWTQIAKRRRVLLALLVTLPTIIASNFMLDVLPDRGWPTLERSIAILFGLLFGWISLGLWQAVAGFCVLMRGRDRWAITRLGGEADESGPLTARTAIAMPICEEPVARVFAGLAAIYRSLERTGMIEHFDFFILSDSRTPETWVEEEAAWARLCREVGGSGRIFYRRRRVRVKRKSGNVADFCRRWGSRYPYLVVLDSDSIMDGRTIVRMVRTMERHRGVGLIQTLPTVVRSRSLLARVQQFSSHVYGPLFGTGLHFWQLGDSQFLGHNAIIRIEPFMRHCALPRLPGKPPLGGEILSHDFVESALLARAGWSIWLAYDLGGSWEETPGSLAEELARDRRWCQGNLQHLRLLFTRGLYGTYRALFVNGAMAYLSALLWLCFLVLATVQAGIVALVEPDYFPTGRALFPQWPVWRPAWAIALLTVTAAVLFLPKVLGVLWALPRRKGNGGFFRLIASALLEVILSSLLAPIRMVSHTKFVVLNLLGRTVQWRAGKREDGETGWGEALRRHGVDAVLGLAWGVGLYLLNPEFFWWIMPILGALVLSVPIAVLASRESLGALARRLGLFLIPEEIDPPAELRDLEEGIEHWSARAPLAGDGDESAVCDTTHADAFVRTAIDPQLNLLHRSLLRGPRTLTEKIRAEREEVVERALRDGPDALTSSDRNRILIDSAAIGELHERVWDLEGEDAARWGVRPAS